MDISANNQSITDREYFAVIDTETTWQDEVMSIGVVIAHKNTYHIAAEKYYVITPECKQPAMYGYALNDFTPITKCNRTKAISDLHSLLGKYCIEDIFAYNARFDYRHLPELKDFVWRDIMRIAAYKQFNPSIPDDAECCSTGRLKSNYGVESMMKLLIGNGKYFEKHNAAFDAEDEMLIMQVLGYPTEQYPSIQEISSRKVRIHTRRPERCEQREDELQKHLDQKNIDLISFETTNKPVMIKCRICGHSWNVSFRTASTGRPMCPRCFPMGDCKAKISGIQETSSMKAKIQIQPERYERREDELQKHLDRRNIDLISFEAISKPVMIKCRICGYSWNVSFRTANTGRPVCPCCFPTTNSNT